MLRTPDVTVIIPVYNGEGTIERALDSIIGQTLGLARMQVLVVDDGSTDESPAILDRIAQTSPSIEVFRQPNSGGPAAPRNFAMQRARGRYTFFLDQDDYLAPNALQAMVRIADRNGTDVVVPRIKGVGGRGGPLPMTVRTVPRTDVFSSAAYWTLGPIKLVRTNLVQSLGLQFGEDFRVHEDIGFVAEAYIRGNGISILADKDYVFWTQREDGTNITSGRKTIAERLPGVSHIFDLIGRLVPEGSKRDAIMRRLFEVETRELWEVYGVDSDETWRQAAFARLREIVAAYHTKEIARFSAPAGRVLMSLVSAGQQEKFLEYIDALSSQAAPAETVMEGEHIFLMLPWFRDPVHGLPDEMFDIAPTLSAFVRVEPIGVEPKGIGIRALCRLGPLSDGITDVDLVARSAGAADVSFPLGFHIVIGDGDPYAQVDGLVPSARLLALPRGRTFDLYVRVASGDTWRERRLVECAPPATGRILTGAAGAGAARYALLSANAKAELSISALDGLGLARRVAGRARRALARSLRRRISRAAQWGQRDSGG